MEITVIRTLSAADLEATAERAAEVLCAGGLVVHPTETVYGIGGDASEQSNRLIGCVKQRERDQPLILLTPDLGTLRACYSGIEWPEGADELARRFWPGALTLVVRCSGAESGLCGPGAGIAVRVSPDPVVAAILARWRRPMTSTSANRTGAEPARTLESALEVFKGRDDLRDVRVPVLAIDAGAAQGARPSTIVSFAGSRPRLLREGPVTREQIEEYLPGLD